MTNKKMEKTISEILENDPVVIEYNNKKKQGILTFNDKFLHAKYLVIKISELYSIYYN